MDANQAARLCQLHVELVDGTTKTLKMNEGEATRIMRAAGRGLQVGAEYRTETGGRAMLVYANVVHMEVRPLGTAPLKEVPAVKPAPANTTAAAKTAPVKPAPAGTKTIAVAPVAPAAAVATPAAPADQGQAPAADGEKKEGEAQGEGNGGAQ